MEKGEELATKILDEARAAIQANMAVHYRTKYGERWVNASGRSSAAFQVVTEEGHVRLVYRGSDVAPLETIQWGYKGEADLQKLEEWKSIKEAQGAIGIPPARKVQERIERDGTERYADEQDWIISPVISLATQALRDQLPKAIVQDITDNINKEING